MAETGANATDLSTTPPIVAVTEKSQSTQEIQEEKESTEQNTGRAQGAGENDKDQRTEKREEGAVLEEHNSVAQQQEGETEDMGKKGKNKEQPRHLNNDESTIQEEEIDKQNQKRGDNVYHNVLSSFEITLKQIEDCNKRDTSAFAVDSAKIEQLKNSYTLVHEDKENYQKLVETAKDNTEKQEKLVKGWDEYLANWEKMATDEQHKYRTLQKKLAVAKERQVTTVPSTHTNSNLHTTQATKRTYAAHATQPAITQPNSATTPHTNSATTPHTTFVERKPTAQHAQTVLVTQSVARSSTTPFPTHAKRTVVIQPTLTQSLPALPAVKLYVLQEDFKDIGQQLEKLLKPYVNCQVVEWREGEAEQRSMLLHCVVVDTRLDHIALPTRVKQLVDRWGKSNYIFLRVHNQAGVTYENDDVNLLLEGVQVWKSKYKVKINMGANQSYAKEFIDSENIIPSLVKMLHKYS
eukprot:Phypoly_transcript_03106.p1 GENE.Phypoly_transcript_03106~~Phypoly_transcript_03106.p1  ORF type:complete len:465 (-),score=88.83 Phypoly_transcript_03106:48-1442(-)